MSLLDRATVERQRARSADINARITRLELDVSKRKEAAKHLPPSKTNAPSEVETPSNEDRETLALLDGLRARLASLMKARATRVSLTDDALTAFLTDGRAVTVPLAWFPKLHGATAEQRNGWQLVGTGEGIHWADLDENLSVEGLLQGRRQPSVPPADIDASADMVAAVYKTRGEPCSPDRARAIWALGDDHDRRRLQLECRELIATPPKEPLDMSGYAVRAVAMSEAWARHLAASWQFLGCVKANLSAGDSPAHQQLIVDVDEALESFSIEGALKPDLDEALVGATLSRLMKRAFELLSFSALELFGSPGVGR